MITDPVFYLCAVPAVLIFAIGKGGLGGALGTISVPLMALVISPVQAAAIMLPILCVMDLVALWSFRSQFSREHLKIILPASLVGIVAASFLMGKLSTDGLRVIIGVTALVFSASYWLGLDRLRGRPGANSGRFWAAVSGFTSTQIHAGGIPLNVYLLPQGLDKMHLVGTMAVFFAFLNYVKLVPYSLLGLFDATNLYTALVLMPLAPIGVRLGYWLLARISQVLVYRILYVMLTLSGIKLLVDGLT